MEHTNDGQTKTEPAITQTYNVFLSGFSFN